MIVALALGVALVGGACERAHMTASYGRANHDAFTRQMANPTAGTKPAPAGMVQGLDSQEAAIVSKTYRRNLAPRDEEAASRGQMLYYNQRPPQADRGDMPPPSVPNQQR
jgi:hypothetical protein